VRRVLRSRRCGSSSCRTEAALIAKPAFSPVFCFSLWSRNTFASRSQKGPLAEEAPKPRIPRVASGQIGGQIRYMKGPKLNTSPPPSESSPDHRCRRSRRPQSRESGRQHRGPQRTARNRGSRCTTRKGTTATGTGTASGRGTVHMTETRIRKATTTGTIKKGEDLMRASCRRHRCDRGTATGSERLEVLRTWITLSSSKG
jgi:hypothetical protein